MGNDDDADRSLIELDAMISEDRTIIWLYGVSAVSAALCLIPGFPAITAVMLPVAVTSIRNTFLLWRRSREVRRLRALEGKVERAGERDDS